MKDPISKFNWKSLQQQANHVLGDEFWEDILEMVPNLGPRADVYETEEEVVAIIELPGLGSTRDVKVTFNNSNLMLEGDIERGFSDGERNIIRSERFSGHFKREILLPKNIVYSNIRAKYHRGLLEVRLFKENIKEQPVHIEVHEKDIE
jgi:HSP20 family protein